MDKIKEDQKLDKEIEEIKSNMSKGKAKGFHKDDQGIIWFEKRVCVPQDPELRKLILQEAHDSPYCIHPRNTKMYMDLKGRFWWSNMKRDVTEYIALCDMCNRVKVEHQKPAGLLQPLPILEWKWVIRLKRIYNFLCSMLVFTPFALCFITLRGIFM
jgi:hypothetical protein